MTCIFLLALSGKFDVAWETLRYLIPVWKLNFYSLGDPAVWTDTSVKLNSRWAETSPRDFWTRHSPPSPKSTDSLQGAVRPNCYKTWHGGRGVSREADVPAAAWGLQGQDV